MIPETPENLASWMVLLGTMAGLLLTLSALWRYVVLPVVVFFIRFERNMALVSYELAVNGEEPLLAEEERGKPLRALIIYSRNDVLDINTRMKQYDEWKNSVDELLSKIESL